MALCDGLWINKSYQIKQSKFRNLFWVSLQWLCLASPGKGPCIVLPFWIAVRKCEVTPDEPSASPGTQSVSLVWASQETARAHTQGLPGFFLHDFTTSPSSPLQTPSPAGRERLQTHRGAPTISGSMESWGAPGHAAHDFLLFHHFPGFKQV